MVNILLEENSKLNVTQYYVSTFDSSKGLMNHVNEYSIKENASLKVDRYQKIHNNYNICCDLVTQEKGSELGFNCFSCSGLFIREDLNVKVVGENCLTDVNGVFTPSYKEYIDYHVLIDHVASNCQSHENFKGILKGNAVGVFNGKVIVQKDAQKIEAFQKNNNVLLDENSLLFSKPELEIYADDVKCSHGSTTGKLDEEALFYLRSRGLSRQKAVQLLILGFVNEVVEKVSQTNFKNFILEQLNK